MINMLENKKRFFTFEERFQKTINGEGLTGSFKKFKASVLSILLGFILGGIIIVMQGGDVFKGYESMFKLPFNEINFTTTLYKISIFIILGVGIGISFKTGLFNIGAAGQFLMAGTVTMMIGSKVDMPKGIGVILLLLVGFLVGAITAGLAGFLKGFFNVHEVVSTILLNWIFFYLAKYIVQSDAFVGLNESSINFNENMRFSNITGTFDAWVAVMIAITIALTIFTLFKYTTTGYKLKVNGLSSTAADYAGINKKLNTILSMALSGGLIGIAGYISYSFEGNIPKLDALPSQGFDAITVTLLSFSSPLGTIASGAFFGIIQQGSLSAHYFMGGNTHSLTIPLVIGIIVLGSSLTNSFVDFSPFKFTYDKLRIMTSGLLWSRRKKYLDDIKVVNKEKYEKFKEYKLESIARDKLRNEIKDKYIGQVSEAQNNLRDKKIEQVEFKELKNSYKQEMLDSFTKEKIQTKSEINKKYNAMISSVEKEYKDGSIDALQKNEKIIKIVADKKVELEQNKIIAKMNIRKISRARKTDLKKEFKLEIHDHYLDYKNRLAIIKQTRKDSTLALLNDLETKYGMKAYNKESMESMRNELRNESERINDLYKDKKFEIKKWWKGVQE